LTSPDARRKLRDLKTTDPEFWGQLTGTAASVPIANDDGNIIEDQENTDSPFEDDSDLSCNTIVANMHGSNSASVGVTADGSLVSTVMAESLREGDGDSAEARTSLSIEAEGSNRVVRDSSEVGRGKRKKTQNRMYESFWRHDDEDPSDAEDTN
jgi:hypothetical protein